jgi:proteic killer suppression protein
VLRSIADRLTQDVYDATNSRYSRKLPRHLHAKARRLLDQINAAPSLDMLRTPPSNRLEKLRGDLESHWSLRINEQWRIIFRWEDSDAFEVKIMDYHD